MFENPWRYCSKEKPPEYVRVEIKNAYCQHYVGYRYKNKYYETIGNFIIEDPFQWRYIPVGSYLWEEIKSKIHDLSTITTGNLAIKKEEKINE